MADDTKEYVTGTHQWIYLQDKKPPAGKKLFILQGGGVAITGNWRDDAGYIAYQEMFKRNYVKEEAHAKACAEAKIGLESVN